MIMATSLRQNSHAGSPSTIATLHERYEAAYREYNAVEAADMEIDTADADADDQLRRFRYDSAKNANEAECDALRTAMLFQVPADWVDAMILQFHLYVASDLALNGSPTDVEKTALAVAHDTLLDFMCCNINTDHGEIGKQFQTAANRVFDRRRLRTGEVEA